MKLWILFILVLTFIPRSITPQSKNGTIVLGGKISYNSSEINHDIYSESFFKYDKSTNFSFSPRIGYFLSENLQFGIGLKYEKNKKELKTENDDNSISLSNSMFAVNPSLRYYQNISAKFGFYGELEVAIGSGSQEEVNWGWSGSKTEYVHDLNQIAIMLNPGIYYSLNNNFSIEVGIGGVFYSSITSKLTKPENAGKPKDTHDDFGIELSFESLSLGLVYVF